MSTLRRIACGNNLSLSELAATVSKLRVSVLPDFFLDRIMSTTSLNRLFKEARAKAAAGGGSLRGYLQSEIRGGNATNLAYALASLSVRTNLYCIGNDVVRAATTNAPGNCHVNVIPGRPGYTVALEFPYKARMVNVMLSDEGDLADFDGRKLDTRDVSTFRNSDCIALVNWSANKSGNALAKKVFSIRGRNARLNFLDPADLSGAEGRIKGLGKIIDDGMVDVISLNENETRILANFLSVNKLPRRYKPRDILRTSRSLHDKFQVTVDIHTPFGSASANDGEQAWVPAFGFVRAFVTGAGDVWDAGDIVAHLLGFGLEDRLRLANACAYLFLSSDRVQLPTLSGVERFLARSHGARV